jgi:hypothetical protein
MIESIIQMFTTTLSLVAFCFLGVTGHVTGISEYHDALAFETDGNFGISIGGFILGPESVWPHEYGHYIQSRELGIAYIPMVVIPGALHAFRYLAGFIDHREYFDVWFEREAQEYAAEYGTSD